LIYPALLATCSPHHAAGSTMASASALIFVILGSQISTGLAVMCPLMQDSAACYAYSAGCSCAERGLANGVATATYTPGSEDACCTAATPVTCTAIYTANPAFCGTGKRIMYSKATAAAGATSVDNIANCCETIPTVTCADVSCTAARRRAGTAHMKMKTGVAATAVTTEAACETSCCELDSTLCVNGQSAGKTCATDFVMNTFVDATGAPTAAAAVTFADDATFKTNCCTAKAVCGAAPTCPAYMTAQTPAAPTKKCAGAVCGGGDCCVLKPTSCIGQGSKCGAGFTLEADAGAAKSFTAGDTDAAIKTACCIATPTATTKTCQDYWDAVTAGAAAAAKKGTTSGAQGASLAMFVVAGLMSVCL